MGNHSENQGELFLSVQGESSLVGRIADRIEHLIVEGRLAPVTSSPPSPSIVAMAEVLRKWGNCPLQ